MSENNDIDLIWPHLLHPDRPELGTTYFAKSPNGVRGGRVLTLDALKRIARNLSSHHTDVYVNINPSSHNGPKGATRDVTHWRHILIDIDPVTTTARPGDARRAVVEQLDADGADLSRRCQVIDSGRGVQMWLVIEPYLLDQQRRRVVERATGEFLRSLGAALPPEFGCRIDSACSDLARVARLPGGINTKTGRRTVLLRPSAGACSPGSILDRYNVEPDSEEPRPALDEGKWNLIGVLKHLTETAATYLIEGKPEPGRHSAAFATAACLCELGIPEEIAENWIAHGAALCTPRLGLDHARQACANAYKKLRLEAAA